MHKNIFDTSLCTTVQENKLIDHTCDVMHNIASQPLVIFFAKVIVLCANFVIDK